MSDPKNFKFCLKVVINKQKTKVLYAEADSDFTDVLLSFLTLPLGTIVKVLGKHYGDEAPVVGSLTSLYNGLSSLDGAHFCTESGKQMLLNPRNSSITECRKLKLNIDDTRHTKYFICRAIDLRGSKTGGVDDGYDGVFTSSKLYFIITDDLQVLPSGAGYAIQIIRNLGITDTNGTEVRDVTFGFNEVMELLKGSFLSKTPLTDLVLKERQMDFVTVKCEIGTLLVGQIEKQTCSTAKKMTVKVILQESTNKLLFAEVEDDFVEFLFSFLTIPLGGVECLLDGRTSKLKNIENLYRSISHYYRNRILRRFLNRLCIHRLKNGFFYGGFQNRLKKWGFLRRFLKNRRRN
ncbi:hypothetical protein PHJA_000099200 [Phtheirospermum japonicum]|uniref:DUF674 family protein n=1 Tax=Phtheirospermum japonicum TaxID=374723 RepID=A0A830AYI9_9LAMI|nr:hypothetical protein PHJA_000099200 [Phtheirospermum japonicum]